MESILTSIKKLLGIEEEYTQFDKDIIVCINTVFGILHQIGVGPATGFKIEDSTSEWSEFIPDESNMEMVKSYMYYKVRLMFDPPQSASLTSTINEQIKELEWRIHTTINLREE